MRRQVCDRLQGTVDTWRWDLQSRWGDPRVYEQQQQTRNKVDAALAHDLSRRNSALLDEAYEKRRETNRSNHTKRIAAKRVRIRDPPRSATPPESAAARARTAPPPDEPPHAHPSASVPPAAAARSR